jgi:hypothetical protein
LELVYRQKSEPEVVTRDGVVGHSSLLPYGKATVNTYALSAFGRGPGWLIHPLTMGELAAAYDLPVRLQKAHWMEEDLLFLDAIPSTKVLMAFQDDILMMTEEERVGLEPISVPSATSTLKGTSEDTIKCIERREMPAEGQDTLASRIAINVSKANDAKVDTWMWDAKMVLDFPQLQSMMQQQVGDINKTLQVGLVNGWKDRMRTECLEYLRETHGF